MTTPLTSLLVVVLVLCLARFAVAADGAANSPANVVAEEKDGMVTVRAGDKTILQYRGTPGGMPAGYDPAFLRGGYISAVYSPGGTLVSDDYPPDHKHHHGIWSPWTRTVFEGRKVDFWNMGEKQGTVEPVGISDVWSRDGAAGFRAKHRMVDLTAPGGPKPALDETWDVTVHPSSVGPGGQVEAYLFDLTITQTTASDSPLTLPKYHYGGLGFRGARDWDGKNGIRFLTSEGLTDRVKANETRAKWAHLSGDVEGKAAGIAILCHPDNFRFPQPIRIHPSEPFFCYAPSQLGEWKIEPGKPYVAKYRFIVTDGATPDVKMIEAMWQHFAGQGKAKAE